MKLLIKKKKRKFKIKKTSLIKQQVLMKRYSKTMGKIIMMIKRNKKRRI